MLLMCHHILFIPEVTQQDEQWLLAHEGQCASWRLSLSMSHEMESCTDAPCALMPLLVADAVQLG